MSEETTTVELPKELQKIADTLDGLTLLQASTLVKALEDKWGVSAAAATVAMPMAGAGGDAGAAAEEQTEFNVTLVSFGEKKIAVIKEVRSITGLGLKEAKDLVDGVPNAVKEGIPKDEADKILAALEAAGATCEIK